MSSVEHHGDPADGCPVAALATDIAREGGGREARRVYTKGVADFADFLATDDQDGLLRLCTLFGALILSRATKGSPMSGEILAAAHAALTEAG
ncbi:hypothetical protein GCM10010392_66130 [Streptomyces clavifer]|uniref:Transcriptional regulator n=1 Tax=Streptomyces clavifer TaxID=68188 RepID=A0ABS4VHW9_9ACTN|nr:hypothetical protein [Streptomyces clavifer]GHB28751.1 hypothetical protein GCM10010392_66130 [Streptomyces clavifer]